MFTYNLIVVSPNGYKANNKQKTIQWPVPIQLGEEIDIAPPGCAGGVTVRVKKIIHWLGIPESDVHCSLAFRKAKMETFKTLTAAEGWDG